MQRIFTAIDISEDARIKVARYIKNIRDEFPNLRVGWERAEKLHLTLKFLGDVGDKQLANLIEAVEETAAQLSDFKLQIAETGAFPSPKNARILWLGVRDEQGSLQRLNNIFNAECERKGLEKEKRSFKSHLTIARLREPARSKELAGKHLRNNFASIEFAVSKIVIYESRLQSSGSIYHEVLSSGFKSSITNLKPET